MEPPNAFIQRLKSNLHLKQDLIVKSRNRWYLLPDTLKQSADKAFFHAGTYLGKLRGRTFFPSISLLAMIAQTRANKTIVNEKTEWLFICGRDIFEEGILRTEGSKKKGDLTIILNQRDECLGLGRIAHNITGEGNGHRVAIRRVLDIGDLLRRERH